MGIFDVFRKKKEEYVDLDKDLKAIMVFFKGVNGSIKNLNSLLKDFQLLRKRELQLVGKEPETVKKLVKAQIKVYDKILKAYELFQLDTDISGERVKKIAKALKNKAKKLKLDQKLLKKLKEDVKWTFDV